MSTLASIGGFWYALKIYGIAIGFALTVWALAVAYEWVQRRRALRRDPLERLYRRPAIEPRRRIRR